jgi:4-hydroxyphenylpyruvate dioxygenase-like putative hemolysin
MVDEYPECVAGSSAYSKHGCDDSAISFEYRCTQHNAAHKQQALGNEVKEQICAEESQFLMLPAEEPKVLDWYLARSQEASYLDEYEVHETEPKTEGDGVSGEAHF